MEHLLNQLGQPGAGPWGARNPCWGLHMAQIMNIQNRILRKLTSRQNWSSLDMNVHDSLAQQLRCH